MRRAVLWPLTGLAVLVGLAVVLVIAGWLYVHGRLDTPGPARYEQTVVLPQGTSAFDIADLLEDAGVIDDPLLFVAGLWIEDKQHSLKAGEYMFEALVTPRGVMEKLVAGDTVLHRLTVTEGMTSAEVVALLNDVPWLVGEIAEVPAEGTLLPETYHYDLGDSRARLIERMEHGMARLVGELWQARDPAVALDSAEQAVVLASIVEKETAVAEERPAHCRRLPQPAVAGHAAPGRRHRGLRRDRRQAAPGAAAVARGPLAGEPLQHLPPARPAAGAHRQSGAGPRSPRSCSRRRPMRSISWPTAPAGTPSRRPWTSTTATSPAGARSGLARRSSQGGSPDDRHEPHFQHDRVRSRRRQQQRRRRLELGDQERERAGARHPLPPAAGAGAARPGGARQGWPRGSSAAT